MIETQKSLIINHGNVKRQFQADEISEELMSAAMDLTQQQFRNILTNFELDKVDNSLDKYGLDDVFHSYKIFI